MDVVARNNVTQLGQAAGRPMLFAHGFGCDQNMWRLVTPAFEEEHRIVLFDHVGAAARTSRRMTATATRRWTAAPRTSRARLRA